MASAESEVGLTVSRVSWDSTNRSPASTALALGERLPCPVMDRYPAWKSDPGRIPARSAIRAVIAKAKTGRKRKVAPIANREDRHLETGQAMFMVSLGSTRVRFSLGSSERPGA
jgi:hypothetical protein